MRMLSSEELRRLVAERGFDGLLKLLREVSQSEVLRSALDRAYANYLEGFGRAVGRFPHTRKLAEEVRRVKEYSIAHIEELVERACDRISSAKNAYCYVAKDAQEARKLVAEILGDSKLVVKSKSITSEEVGLREYLEKLGKEVVETDLGEFLIQHLGSKPMHVTSPSIHVTREVVAELLTKLTGRSVSADDVAGMVSIVRERLRRAYFEADAGISGANAVAADTGALLIIENEGNARLVTGLPEKHVALVGVEKIVPTLLDALKVAEVTLRFSGYEMASYISIVGGPSKTGDIEKKVTYGAHGPRELHVVFVDNGRIRASKDPVLKEALYCLRCGACMYVCPTFRLCGGYWGGSVYVGGIGVAWTAITEGLEQAYVHSLFCSLDALCREQCPMRIDVPRIVREIRRRYHEAVG